MGFSTSPTVLHLQPAARSHIRERVVLGLKTILGSILALPPSKLCASGEVPYPLWAPISSSCLTQDLTGKFSINGRWTDICVLCAQHPFPHLLVKPSSLLWGGLSSRPHPEGWACDWAGPIRAFPGIHVHLSERSHLLTLGLLVGKAL